MIVVPFKSRPTFSTGNDLAKYPLRPIIGQVCRRCFNLPGRNNAVSGHRLVNILHPPVMKQFSFFSSLTPDFYFSFVCSKTFHHKYTDVREKVVNGGKVREGVLKATTQDLCMLESQDCEEILKKHQRRIERVYSTMCAHINRFVLNFSGWILLKLLRRLFRTVQVSSDQLMQIQKATKCNLPIVFLPNHRSHLDYILLTFILWQWGIRAPHVAAGDNLDIPIFGCILQCLGAFFIKRRLDYADGRKDYVYRSILHSYMTELLKSGEYIEFFIEAGRSRFGKTILPKSGLLAVVAETVLEDDISDCYLVPVSISYEKIVDAGFMLELCGEEKPRETFWGIVKAMWQTLRSQYGSVRIDFAQPVLLKDMLERLNRQAKVFQDDMKASSSLQPMPLQVIPCRSSLGYLYGSDLSPGINDDMRHLIKDMSYHVSCDFTENAAHTCTHLLAFLLLNKYSKGGKLSDVVDDFHWLACQIIKRGKNVGFCGNANDVVRYALKLLGPQLVSIEVSDGDSGIEINNSQDDVIDYFIKPSSCLPDVLHLAYYKNAVVPVFLLESIVANALLCLRFEDISMGKKSIRIFENEIIDQCFALCDLLRFDFLFCRPCISLKQSLTETINFMIENGLLKSIFTLNRASEEFWDSTDSEDEPLEKLTENKFYLTDSNVEPVSDVKRIVPKQDRQLELVLTSELRMESFKFFAIVLKPFLKSYLFAAERLSILNKEKEMSEANFVKYLMSEAKKTFNESTFVEFANTESFRNATKWFLQKRLVKLFKVNETNVLRLLEPYDNNEEQLKSFQNSIKCLCSIIDQF